MVEVLVKDLCFYKKNKFFLYIFFTLASLPMLTKYF